MNKRSDPLNKYYWGVCIEMIKDRLNSLEACPYFLSADETHELIKIITKISTTTTMNNKEFLEFLEEVWCIGSHLEIYIPEPNEKNN